MYLNPFGHMPRSEDVRRRHREGKGGTAAAMSALMDGCLVLQNVTQFMKMHAG
jgi:hypothetical protein